MASGMPGPTSHAAGPRRGSKRGGRSAEPSRCGACGAATSLPRVAEAQLDLWSHREALQTLHGHASLVFVLVVHERNVPPGYEAHLLEARVLPEEHRQHGVRCFGRQILHEQRLVWFRHTCGFCRHRLGRSHRLLRIPADAVLDALLRGRGLRGLCWLRGSGGGGRCGGRGGGLALSQVLALHDLFWPLHVCAISLGYGVGLGLGVVDAHRLVVEGEALQRLERVGGRRHLFEDDPSLSTALQRLHRDDVGDATKCCEDFAQRLLDSFHIDLVVEVVHVQRQIGWQVRKWLPRHRLRILRCQIRPSGRGTDTS
mmetsp:Transcript_94906/g.247195  ORF Transcript_94906/g.247195 Transcript_94906/m.247195 type:complete len:313 (-) Transcript_94906:58-996(-)